MLKRILVAATLAGALAGSSVTAAEAGPLRDKVKFALSGAKELRARPRQDKRDDDQVRAEG